MKIPALKWLATIVLTTAAFGWVLASTEAEACSGLFGCCGGGCRGACYGPRTGYYGTVGYGAFYGGFGWRRCAPPCGAPCDPCGSVACAPCSSGDCAISPSSTDTIAPAANEDWQKKKTYSDEQGNTSGSGLGKAGRLPRTNASSGLDDAGKPRELHDSVNDDFKPAKQVDESDTNDGAATDGSESKSSSRGSSKSGKKGPGAPRIDDGSNMRKAPTINLDEKVAWRSAPSRTRLESRPHDANARLVRLPAYPKSDWLPVDSESKVASK
jgi:hypothetical protein